MQVPLVALLITGDYGSHAEKLLFCSSEFGREREVLLQDPSLHRVPLPQGTSF